MKKETLRSVLPFVKEYAAGYGIHQDQSIKYDYYQNNAIAAIVGEAGIRRMSYSSSFCYNSLNSGLGVQKPEAILLQLQPCPADMDEEAYRHYLQWVLNYSPWRHIFVTKSINRALKTRVVVVDPASQKNTMIDGCIAVRQAWDNYAALSRYPQIGLWWELVQKNANPLFAFAIMSNLLYVKGDKMAEGIIHAGHSPISKDWSNSVDNFALGNLKDDSDPWNESREGSAWEVWNHSLSTVKPKLKDLVHTAVSSLGHAKAKVNPFTDREEALLYDKQAVMECLISEIPNMEKEIVL